MKRISFVMATKRCAPLDAPPRTGMPFAPDKIPRTPGPLQNTDFGVDAAAAGGQNSRGLKHWE